MDIGNRIPACADFSFDGMKCWFVELSKQDLLFHPDDDPADIVSLANGEQAFSDAEAQKLRKILDEMFELSGDEVYEACYPVFIKCMELRPGT